jgi:sugar phosphate isomerase/epimerase
MSNSMNRRAFMQWGAGSALALTAVTAQAQVPEKKFQAGVSPWPLCLNSSTIRPTPFIEKIDIAAAAGYDAIEPWINELEDYEKGGGNLKDLGQQIRDKGLFIPNIIGLWSCMPPTPELFEQSLEATRERMRMSAAVGSQHVAAIPSPDREDFDLAWGAEMYRRLLKMGREDYGIIVAFEFVGFLKGVHRLGQACAIAIDANDADACLISDTFHLFRGDSGFEGVQHLNGKTIADFHFNDVPGDVPREEQGDEHRIYPGDGILPLKKLLQDLAAIHYTGPLSLEMFNKAHWEQDPKQVAATGLEKMRGLIASALA